MAQYINPLKPECMEMYDFDEEKSRKKKTDRRWARNTCVKDKCVRVRCENHGDFFMRILRNYTPGSGFRELDALAPLLHQFDT